MSHRIGFPVNRLLAWYDRHRRDLPWRKTRNPYAILVSEVMLQQTQVKTVIPYYERWMKAFADARSLAAAPESRVLKLWEGLGYYRRARNLQAAAREIVGRWKGKFPADFEALTSLPGVGRYTAGAVGSIALGLPLAVVDGNVSRVIARFLGVGENVKSPSVQKKFWSRMESWLPAGRPGDFNQAMMELGATICLPRDPRCGDCPLRRGCVARARGWERRIPVLSKIEPVARYEYAVLLRKNGRIWLTRRTAGQWHEGLWALPSILCESPQLAWLAAFNRRFRAGLRAARPAASARYQVTRHRVTLAVFEPAAGPIQIKRPEAESRLRAWHIGDLEGLAMVTAHRKTLQRLVLI